ncbi:MAG TPA: flagellar biosynthetic protein FliO [Bryobacteraceae bacterium]|nr:flagellar biosynthetic protein FliO [Bryobacteraceae bacterium]
METIRQMLAVGTVLLLLALMLWYLRRKGLARFARATGRGRTLQAVERVNLSPQHSLHLVRLADQGLLVGISPAGCTLLEKFAWESLESQSPADAAREVRCAAV